MNSREELMQMNSKQLILVATEMKIVGRHDMKKKELLEVILNLISEPKTQKPEGEVKQQPTKDYVSNLKGGEIVAFKCGEHKVVSGMVKNRIDADTFLIQTKAGSSYSIKKENVIWVKCGLRWPKWIFDQFGKGSYICQEKSPMLELKRQ